MQTDWGMVIGITITGLLVVFVALILLILCLYLIGAASVFIKNKREKRAGFQSEQKADAPKPALLDEESLQEETVAAITAAVSLMMGQDKAFRIQSVRSVQPGVSWGAVGREENARSFHPFYQGNRR